MKRPLPSLESLRTELNQSVAGVGQMIRTKLEGEGHFSVMKPSRYNVAAFDMVPASVKEVAAEVSKHLTFKGVSHAVIGGMAVSAYSPPRMTKDVDFLVPSSGLEAIRELGDTTPLADSVDGVTVNVKGIDVDFIFMPDGMPEETLSDGPSIDGIPVLRSEALVLMKMNAPRAKDHADVIEMIKAGVLDLDRVRKYIKKHDPDMLEDFESNVMLAEYEKSPGAKKRRK